jgi:hypothetical protein
MYRPRAAVHAVILRAAAAGEIELFVQQRAAAVDGGPDAQGQKLWRWALPAVEGERAEDLLIQTGNALERGRAARRAGLRAAVSYLSAAIPSPQHAPSLPPTAISIPALHHYALDQQELPPDPPVHCFGRLPASLVRAWSGSLAADSHEGSNNAALPPPPPLHLPFDTTASAGMATMDKAQTRPAFVGAAEAYGTRVNEKLPCLVLEALAHQERSEATGDVTPPETSSAGTGDDNPKYMPVVEHIFVLHCLFPELDGDYAGGAWHWCPRAQAISRAGINEVNILGMGRQQCRLGGTWVSRWLH